MRSGSPRLESGQAGSAGAPASPRPAAPGAALRVVELDPAADPRWDAYVEAHPGGQVYHHSAYLRALEGEYGTRPVALAAEGPGGGLVGLLPLMWTRGLPLVPGAVAGRRLASLPRTPVAGPLGDGEAAVAALVEAALARLRALSPAQLQLKLPAAGPGGGAAALDRLPALARHPWRMTYVLELPPPGAELRFGNSRNHARIRWAVGRAERAGLRVRPAESLEDVRRWYPLMLEALRAHAVPPRSRRFFDALWHHLAPRGMMRLLLAEGRDGELVAGSVLLMLRGRTVFYAFNGVRRSALAARPNDLIQWTALHEAAAAGHRSYDFGEVVARQEGLVDFKRKWGTEERRLHRWYHPDPDPGAADAPLDAAPGGLEALAVRAWRKLPLRATAQAGGLLYRWL
jgi:CelD/BcsL family acetyltransferase involved in cellulose biosynthesis